MSSHPLSLPHLGRFGTFDRVYIGKVSKGTNTVAQNELCITPYSASSVLITPRVATVSMCHELFKIPRVYQDKKTFRSEVCGGVASGHCQWSEEFEEAKLFRPG